MVSNKENIMFPNVRQPADPWVTPQAYDNTKNSSDTGINWSNS